MESRETDRQTDQAAAAYITACRRVPRVPRTLVSGACIQRHIAEHQLSVDARQQFAVMLTTLTIPSQV